MDYHRRIAFFFLSVFFLFPKLHAQERQDPTLLVLKDFPSHTATYTVLKDKKSGKLLFGTDFGVLEYDSENWYKNEISTSLGVYVLAQHDDETIYVGGLGDFGFLKKDSVGFRTYSSLLTDHPELRSSADEVWQILFLGEDVLFQSYHGLFRLTDGNLTFRPIKDSYYFIINNEIYYSSYADLTFGKVSGDSLQIIDDSIINDAVYQVIPIQEDRFILFTTDSGPFDFDPNSESLTSMAGSLFDYGKQFYFFDAIKLDHKHIAVGTWDGGLAIGDINGNLLDTINNRQPKFSPMVYGATLGYDQKLWLATMNGIYHLDLAQYEFLDLPVSGTPRASINKVTIENRDEVKSIVDIAVTPLDFSPSLVQFNYSVPEFAGIKTEYSSLLEGYNPDWSHWTNNPSRQFSQLRSGNYTFKVRGRTEKHGESQIATYVLNINLPWYETNAKYALLAPIIAICVYGFVRIRTHSLENQKLRLAEKVSEKTRELQKKAQELERTNKELFQANKELDSFVYHTSHDLKAPLKSILGLVNISKMDGSTRDELRNYLMLIGRSVVKLEEFITSIIEYSINAKSVLQQERIDFDAIFYDVSENLKGYEAMSKVSIRKKIRLEQDFYSDPRRLMIIFSNLITNAVKYHDPYKEDPHIFADIYEQNGQVRVVVQDNGIGINKDQLGKIFEIFYRASERSEGSGLGLYIVKETVAKLDGTIEVDSEYGIGTTFLISFKRSVQPETTESASSK